jgi:hypothetical protein
MLLITDPNLIPASEYAKSPFLVAYNVDNSLLFDAIDLRTNIGGMHPAGHFMTSINPTEFETQGFVTFSQVPMSNYTVRGSWMAFVQLTNSNPDFVKAYSAWVNGRLAAPWWMKLYDFPELLGQAIGLPALSIPGLFDCSMIDMSFLKSCAQYLTANDQMVINSATRFINPEQFWNLILNNPLTFTVYGVYQNISPTARRPL